MADNNPWLTPAVEHDSAPLVASSTSNPLRTGGRFGASSNAFDTPAQGGWDVPSAGSARAPEAAHPTRGAAVLDVHAGDELARRERELKRKEDELEKRFSSLRLREAELGVTKNWPVYLKWIHHDIDEDVSVEKGRSVVRHSYRSFLGLCVCLLYNLIATSANLRWAGAGGIGQWLLAFIYLITGIPGAFFLWHMKLYKVCIDDSAASFLKALLFYLVHVCFVIIGCISPPVGSNDRSLAGFMPAYNIFVKGPRALAIVYMVGGILYAIESLYSFFVLKKIYALYRGRGHSGTAMAVVAGGTGVGLGSAVTAARATGRI